MPKSSEAARHYFPKFGTLPYFLILAFLFAFCAVHFAYADTPPQIPQTTVQNSQITPESTAVISVVIDGQPAGDHDVGIYQNEPIFSLQNLSKLLSDHLKPDIYTTIFQTVFSKLQWIRLADLKLVGIDSKWDMSNIVLTLSIPPTYYPTKTIGLLSDYLPNIKPILHPSALSGYINLNSTVGVAYSGSAVTFPYQLQVNPVINFHDWVGESTIYLDGRSNEPSLAFSSSHIMRDFPAANGRLFLGQVNGGGISYLSQADVLGVAFSSANIRKYRPNIDYLNQFSEFTILKPSVVRIVVNGTDYRTLNLAAGNYRISDLPFTTGLNDFTIVIEDSDGNVRDVRRVIPREANLLGAGVSLYSFAAGVGQINIDQPYATGYYEYGFSSSFTAGIAAQADLRSAMAGAMFILASPIGGLMGSGFATAAWDSRAHPLSAASSLQYRLQFPGRSIIPTITLGVDYITQGFSAPFPDSTLSLMDETLRLSGSLSGRLGPTTSFGMSPYWNRTFGTIPTETTGINLSISQGFPNSVSASFLANVYVSPGSAPNFSVSIMLFILPRDHPGDSFNFIQSADGTNTISLLQKTDILGGLDASFSGSNLLPGTGDFSSIGLGLRKNSQWGDLAVNLATNYGNVPGGQSKLAFSVNGVSAIAFAGGKFALSRTLYDSFVLLAPEADLADQRVYYRVDGAGNVVSSHGQPSVLPLQSYRSTAAYMDLPEAPPDITPLVQAALISTSYKSGVLYTSGVLKRYKIKGRLLDAAGKPIGYMAGDILDLGGTNFSSTFTDDKGVFEIYDLSPGSYEISWPDTIGNTPFKVSGTPTGTIDLGDVRATPATSAAPAAQVAPGTGTQPSNTAAQGATSGSP